MKLPLLLAMLASASCQPAEPPGPAANDTGPIQQAAREAPIIITDPGQREAAVGKLVTVIGILTRTKMPQVNGVDVDANGDLAGRRVRVEGILKKRVVEPVAPDPDELPIATRGPGTYYAVIDPDTGLAAQPRAE